MGHVRRLIVFDLDGTLIDSRQDLADAANALIAELGGATLPAATIVRMVGEGAAVLVRRALEAAGLGWTDASLARFLALYDERLLRTTRLYPGVLEAVREVGQFAAVAVLTNKPAAPTRTLLQALGLAPFIGTTIGGDGPFPRKPSPASLEHLMTLYGADRRHTVLVGDSRIDFETARAARTNVCLARYGFGYEMFPQAELRGDESYADTPAEIPAATRRQIGDV